MPQYNYSMHTININISCNCIVTSWTQLYNPPEICTAVYILNVFCSNEKTCSAVSARSNYNNDTVKKYNNR